MSTLMERVEELRTRIRTKLGLRGKIFPVLGEGTFSPQIQIGGGKLIATISERLDRLTAKAQELRPGIIPKLAEIKPGERIVKLFAPETEHIEIEKEKARETETENISIET